MMLHAQTISLEILVNMPKKLANFKSDKVGISLDTFQV